MKGMIKKWKGGAEKHGGLDKAALAQVHTWTAPSSSSSSQDESALRREAEELVARKEAEELVARREAEEVVRREAEELVARKEAEELVARREAEELVARREAEEVVRREAEEVAAKKQAEKPTLKKFMLDFLRKSEDIEDDVAFSNIAKLHESQEDNATLAQRLFSLKDPVINKAVVSWFMPAASEGVVAAMGEGVVGDDVADDF